MKKLFVFAAASALIAACSNAPKVSESAAKVTELTNWVDSVKGLVASATNFDSATWASYSEQFNSAMSGINEAELDETTKAALETIKTTWTGVGESYSSGIENAKKAAMEAAMAADTTAANAEQTIIDKAKEAVQDGADAIKKKMD